MNPLIVLSGKPRSISFSPQGVYSSVPSLARSLELNTTLTDVKVGAVEHIEVLMTVRH
jgi:hypothetical protein